MLLQPPVCRFAQNHAASRLPDDLPALCAGGGRRIHGVGVRGIGAVVIALASGLAVPSRPAWAQPAPTEASEASSRHLPPAAGQTAYAALIEREAGRRGIPAALAHAVTMVESGWNPAAVGTSGEIGLMQVMPTTASMLGFRGTLAQLAEPAVNIQLGVQYLSGAWALAGGDLCTTLMKYRAGHGETVMSARSMEYCQRAQRYLASVGSPLASSAGAYVIPATLGRGPAWQGSRQPPGLVTSAEWVRMKSGQRTVADSERFWAARALQLQALRTQHAATMASRTVLTRHAHLAPSYRGEGFRRVASYRRWRVVRAARAASRFAARPAATPLAGPSPD